MSTNVESKRPTSISATRPVNPPGCACLLTAAQVWAGLEIKLRRPMTFVDAITHCELAEDDGHKIVRLVKFGDDPTLYSEPCYFFPNTVARGHLPNGADISDVISYGPNDELWLTFTCAGVVPGNLAAGDPPPAPHVVAARIGAEIERALVRIRALVEDGTIKA